MREKLNDIRTLRASHNPPLLQRELGERVGVEQTDIAAYENGRVFPTLKRAFEISIALGRPVEQVFYGLYEVTSGGVAEREASRAIPAEGGTSPPATKDSTGLTGGREA